MKVVARTDEYTIYQRRDERYAVQNAVKKPINGSEKIEILLKHELIKAAPPKVEQAEEPAAESASDDASDASDVSGDDAPGEQAADAAAQDTDAEASE